MTVIDPNELSGRMRLVRQWTERWWQLDEKGVQSNCYQPSQSTVNLRGHCKTSTTMYGLGAPIIHPYNSNLRLKVALNYTLAIQIHPHVLKAIILLAAQQINLPSPRERGQEANKQRQSPTMRTSMAWR